MRIRVRYKNGHCHHHKTNVSNQTRDTKIIKMITPLLKKEQGEISNFTYKVFSWNNDASAEEGISFIKLKLQSLIGE